MDRNMTVPVSPGNNSRVNSNCSYDNTLLSMLLPLMYSLLFLVGLVLNAVAMWVFLRIPSKSYFIVYLKNIVVADMISTFTFPIMVLSNSNLRSTELRVFTCRVSSVIFYLMMYVSIVFFSLISLDRCRKTLTPFRATTTARLFKRKILTGVIWAVLLSLMLPNMFLTNQAPTSPCFHCRDLKSRAGKVWHNVVTYVVQVIFWVALAMVTVCYALISRELYRSYRKAHQSDDEENAPQPGRATLGAGSAAPRKINPKVFLIIVVFFVCFAPYHLARVLFTMSQTREGWLADHLTYFQLKESTLFLSALNAVLDPLLYFFLCKSFRTMLFKSLRLPLGTCSGSTGSSSSSSE